MLRKGITALMSTVIVIALSIAAIAIVLLIGVPAIDKGKEAVVVDEAMNNMKAIANIVKDVSSEGVGSLRTLQIKVSGGEYKINDKSNSIDFTYETKSGIVEPGSFIKEGDITMSSGAYAKASEYDLNNDNSADLVLENDILRIGILKNGTKTNPAFINTSNLIRVINFKSTNANVTPSDSSILIDDSLESSYGTGYSEIVKIGDNMAESQVLVHMNTNYAVYEILYTLQSGADFVIVKIQNAYYK